MANGSTPDYAALLAQAQMQLFLLASGQAPQVIETPQLGRVAYMPTTITQLQQLIDYLKGMVDPTTAASTRRRPISVEACP
jgi:hypothetical protein